jgi:ankyrin repeat protein
MARDGEISLKSKYSILNFTVTFFVLLFSLNGVSCRNNINENLLEAASKADLSTVKDLLDKGANPDYPDVQGKTALHILCSLPSLENESRGADSMIFNFIQHGANVNLPDKKGNTPLFYSTQAGNYDATVSLVNHGANVNQRNNDLRTPLFNAVAFVIAGVKEIRGLEFVRFLYQAGADIFVKDKEGKNLMHNSKDPVITAWLIDHGLSPSLRDNYGKTPLDYFSAEIFKVRDSMTGYSKTKDKAE